MTMTLDEFMQSLQGETVPAGLTSALAALWLEKHGDWAGAHTVLQSAADADSAWVHAYLHRKEGDVSNAGYWYRRAGQPACGSNLDTEWQAIVARLLGQEAGADAAS